MVPDQLSGVCEKRDDSIKSKQVHKNVAWTNNIQTDGAPLWGCPFFIYYYFIFLINLDSYRAHYLQLHPDLLKLSMIILAKKATPTKLSWFKGYLQQKIKLQWDKVRWKIFLVISVSVLFVCVMVQSVFPWLVHKSLHPTLQRPRSLLAKGKGSISLCHNINYRCVAM